MPAHKTATGQAKTNKRINQRMLKIGFDAIVCLGSVFL